MNSVPECLFFLFFNILEDFESMRNFFHRIIGLIMKIYNRLEEMFRQDTVILFMGMRAKVPALGFDKKRRRR